MPGTDGNDDAQPYQSGPELLALIQSDAAAGDIVTRLRRTPAAAAAAAIVNYQDETGLSPLGAAAAKGQLEVVKALVEAAGADVGLRDARLRSPLLLAAEEAQAAVFLYLWQRRQHDEGVDADCFGRSALHWWCKHGRTDCVRAVLESSSGGGSESLQARTTSGETPLFWALGSTETEAPAAREEVVRLLLAAGADPRATNGMGQRPLDLVGGDGGGGGLRGLLEAAVASKQEQQQQQEEEGKETEKTPAAPTAATAAVKVSAPPMLPRAGLLAGLGVGRAAGAAVGGAPAKKLKIKLKAPPPAQAANE